MRNSKTTMTSEEPEYDVEEANYFKTLSSSILAKALFRGGTVYSSPPAEQKWANAAISVIEVFDAYHLEVSSPTSRAFKATNLAGFISISQAQYNGTSHVRFCCGRCKKRDIFSLIAVGHCILKNNVECIEIESVFFYHDTDCSGEERKPSPRYQVFDLDFPAIIGDAYEPLVSKLKTFHFVPGAENQARPPGSHINYGSALYNYDDRSYLYIPSNTHYPELPRETHRETMVRLFYFLAVNRNMSAQAAYQVLDLETFIACCLQAKQIGHYPVMANAPNYHLHFFELSLLFGGHSMMPAEDGEVTHQICHMDLADLLSVPALETFKGKQKPASFIMPLENERTIYVNTLHTLVTVKKGQVLFFEGDLAHGGITYHATGEGNDWYPAIHGHLDSTLFERKRGLFEFKNSTNVYYPDEHLQFEKDLGPPLVAAEKTLGLLIEQMSLRSEEADGEEYIQSLEMPHKKCYNRSLCGTYQPNLTIGLDDDPPQLMQLLNDTLLRLEELSLAAEKLKKKKKKKTTTKKDNAWLRSIDGVLAVINAEGAFTPESINNRVKEREAEQNKLTGNKRKKGI